MRTAWIGIGFGMLAATGCGGAQPDGGRASSGAVSVSGTGITGPAATGGDGSGSGGDDTDSAAGKLDVGVGGTGNPGDSTYPVRMLPGLVSISFYERTGGDAPDESTFLVDGPELSARLDDPLAAGNTDITGVPDTEFYDVYYSDQDGNFELDGRYLTISGTFGEPLPAGGGLNLAEIGLNFEDATTEFGNYVASYVKLGDNAVEPDGNVENSIDGDLQTHTTMGNTSQTMERLRITLGFLSTSGPPP